MTKKELEQLRSLPAEIRAIRRDIDNLPVVTDTVTGSRLGIPYDLHAISIEGVDLKRELRLRMRLKFREEELKEIEDKVDTITDGEIRRIIDLRYCKKKAWVQVAREIGGNATADGLRMKLDRFLEKS